MRGPNEATPSHDQAGTEAIERLYTNRSRVSNAYSPPPLIGKLKPREGLLELTELGGPEVVSGHPEQGQPFQQDHLVTSELLQAAS